MVEETKQALRGSSRIDRYNVSSGLVASGCIVVYNHLDGHPYIRVRHSTTANR